MSSKTLRSIWLSIALDHLTATDLSNCENILTNSAATASSFAAGEDVNIAGTFTRPSDGTYTHAYIRFDNVIGITAAMKFDTSINGGGSGTGKFCRTIVSSGTHQSGSSHDLSVCASSETTPGKLTETLKQFGNADGTYRGCVKDGTVAAASSGSCGTLGSTNGFLVDTDLKLATASSGVDDFHGILAFGTPQKITPNTTSFVVRFDVTNGAVTAKTGSGTSGIVSLQEFADQMSSRVAPQSTSDRDDFDDHSILYLTLLDPLRAHHQIEHLLGLCPFLVQKLVGWLAVVGHSSS